MCEEMLLHLKWDNFSSHLALSFDSCYETQRFVDVSLVCKNGEVLKGHKMILANSSKLFRRLLTENEHPHPMILMLNITADDMRSMMAFMYCGEVQVEQSDLKRFLEIAEILEVTGLSQIQESVNTKDANNLDTSNTSFNGSAKGSSRSEQDVRSTNSCNTSPPPLVRFNEPPGNSPKNLDCSLTSFQSSSKKLQAIAKKFENTIPPNRQSLDGSKSELDILDRVVKSTGEFASSSRRLQEMAKSLENINNYNPGINWNKLSKVICKDKAESTKRACTDDTERPSKKSNLNPSIINVSELEDKSSDQFGTKGKSNAQDDDQTTNCDVYIKDEIDMENVFAGDHAAVYSMEMQAENEIQNRCITASSAMKTSSILAAELLKGVARNAKDEQNSRSMTGCNSTMYETKQDCTGSIWDDERDETQTNKSFQPNAATCETQPKSNSPKTNLSAFEKYVIRMLSLIKMTLDEHGEILDRLMKLNELAAGRSNEINEFEENTLPPFPLPDELNFNNLEELLHNDQTAVIQLVTFMKSIGGKSTADVTRRILYRCMSKELAMTFSWLGKKGNRKLKDTAFAAALFTAVKANVEFASTDREIEKAIMDWCRHAPDRFKRCNSTVLTIK